MLNVCGRFQWKNFGLCCDNLRVLVECKWPIPTFWYMVYRLIITLYIAYGLGVMTSMTTIYFFIYFTNWSYTLLVVNFIVKAIAALKYFPVLEDKNATLPACGHYILKISWLLTNITTPAAVLVSIVYWTVIAPYSQVDTADIHSHAMNVVVIMIDYMMISMPCRLSHIYQPLLYALTYFTFSAIYWSAGGVDKHGKQKIYEFLDWSKPATTLIYLLALGAALALIYFVVYVLSIVKGSISYYIFKKNKCATAVTANDIQMQAKSETNEK